jgi:hypothetical protein
MDSTTRLGFGPAAFFMRRTDRLDVGKKLLSRQVSHRPMVARYRLIRPIPGRLRGGPA